MKKLLLLAVLCAPVLMGNTGCSTSNPISSAPIINGNSVNQTVPKSVSNGAKKALTAADQAYTAVGAELISSAQSGILRGANAKKAQDFYDKAGDVLRTAHKAEALADETSLMAAIGEANTLMAQATTLVGG